jgi:cobalamin biosynthesis protein CobT
MEQKTEHIMKREIPTALHALRKDSQTEILGHFSPDEQQVIKHKQRILSSLAYFIGKDFQIPVDLNKPGAGWHWNFVKNIIRIDPQDLLTRNMDYLRYVICHEGGHKRISRVENIPIEIWKQPGFSSMMNAIEDPRTDNFVAEAYPRFRDQMDIAYQEDLDFEGKAKEKAHDELGYTPRFMQAGFEYIRQWYRETQGEELGALSEDLPEEVKTVVKKTLESARDSWLRYPSKQEADGSEELIKRYANVSYEINRDEIWPEFQKLVEQDMQDQEMQEFMKDMQGDGESEEQQGLSQELSDLLTEDEQKELEEAIENAQQGNQTDQEGTGQPRAIDLDSLSEGLTQKIKDYIDTLPEDAKRELAEKAQKALQDFEREVNEEFEGKLSDNPEKKAQRGETTESQKKELRQDSKDESKTENRPEQTADQKRFKDLIEKVLLGDENIYEEYRRDVLPLIDSLESDLREIFVARRSSKWQTGFKSGKRIVIKRRMQEKALGISAFESRAWQKREIPQEKDYAISLLVDLTGSMQGQKIEETFRAIIVLAEVLNRLSMSTEILGFNTELYEYQSFGQDMSREIRELMGGMLQEVEFGKITDLGWAVQQASGRLDRQKATEKFLLVLSDGKPYESSVHSGSQYELGRTVNQIMENTDQKLIGLGIGPDTNHVKQYFPNSIANIGVKEMSKILADVIREVVANYDTF